MGRGQMGDDVPRGARFAHVIVLLTADHEVLLVAVISRAATRHGKGRVDDKAQSIEAMIPGLFVVDGLGEERHSHLRCNTVGGHDERGRFVSDHAARWNGVA